MNEGSNLKKNLGIAGAAVVATLGFGAATHMLDFPHVPGAPTQEEGETRLENITVTDLEAMSTDAVVEFGIEPERIEQDYIDKRDKPTDDIHVHETLVAGDGEYKATLGIGGKWEAEKTEDGIVVSLPSEDSISHIRQTQKPKLIAGEGHRDGLWAATGFVSGATQDDDLIRNAVETLEESLKDPNQYKTQRKALACTVLAGATDKANILIDTLDAQAYVETFGNLPNRETRRAAARDARKANIPVVEFQIEGPDGTLDIDECRGMLEGIGFDPDTQATTTNYDFGISDQKIPVLTLGAIEQ